MKLIKFTGYLFYRYYSTGKNYGIPYANTIIALTLLCFINLFSILILLDANAIIPSFDAQQRIETFIKTALFVLPISIIFLFLVKKKKLEKMNFEEKQIKRGNVFLVCYIMLSVSILIFSIWYKQR